MPLLPLLQALQLMLTLAAAASHCSPQQMIFAVTAPMPPTTTTLDDDNTPALWDNDEAFGCPGLFSYRDTVVGDWDGDGDGNDDGKGGDALIDLSVMKLMRFTSISRIVYLSFCLSTFISLYTFDATAYSAFIIMHLHLPHYICISAPHHTHTHTLYNICIFTHTHTCTYVNKNTAARALFSLWVLRKIGKLNFSQIEFSAALGQNEFSASHSLHRRKVEGKLQKLLPLGNKNYLKNVCKCCLHLSKCAFVLVFL